MNFNSLLSIILSLSNGNTSKAFSEFLSVLTSGLVAATSELEKYNSALHYSSISIISIKLLSLSERRSKVIVSDAGSPSLDCDSSKLLCGCAL